jgi:hypothetical protein
MPKPTKQAVRDWLRREVEAHRPPPSPDEVRDELGWTLDREDETIVAEFRERAKEE